MHEQEKEAEAILERPVFIIIPECCREGWDTCEHVPKKAKKLKRNIAL